MSETPFTKYGGVKPYVIILHEEHKYSTLNLPFKVANLAFPERTVTLSSGTILWCQDTPFTPEQRVDLKAKGFPYQWGFGPCCEMIPLDKIKLGKIDFLNI